MVILLLAAVLMLLASIFFPICFDTDTGIEFRRELVVSWNRVTLLFHSLHDGYTMVKDYCSIWPLRAVALLGCAACVYAAFEKRVERVAQWVRIAFALGLSYYVVLVGYIVYLSGTFIATVRLRWAIVLPAVAILLLQLIIRYWYIVSDDEEGD